MSDKPIIGITVESKHDPSDERSLGSMALNWNYAKAIADAGGVPLVIPPHADASSVAPLLDGWLIPGGLDIDASRFGQANHPEVELQDPARFESEAALFEKTRSDMPILGICYGCQFINVVRGGTLHQHIPDILNGETYHSGGTLAKYAIEPDSKLSEYAGTEQMSGKSYHHQAIDKVGRGLTVVATHEDGTIEAVEATDRPWMIGVQWHPERTLGDHATLRLFDAFVTAAAEFRKRKFAAMTEVFLKDALPAMIGQNAETLKQIESALKNGTFDTAEKLGVVFERMMRS